MRDPSVVYMMSTPVVTQVNATHTGQVGAGLARIPSWRAFQTEPCGGRPTTKHALEEPYGGIMLEWYDLNVRHGHHFMVDSAKLCYKLGPVLVELNGKRFGMNGPAMPMLRKHGRVFLDPNEILRDPPDRWKWTEVSENCGVEMNWKVSAYRLPRDALALGHQP